MTIVLGNKKVKDVGSWQEYFVPSYSERIKKAKEHALQTPEICLERARAEMKVYEQYKDEPRIIQRARFVETYLREKKIFILDEELIVGNVNSKIRALTVSGTVGRFFAYQLKEVLNDPNNFEIRYKGILDFIGKEGIVYPEEKKELFEVIFPYFKGKTLLDYNYARLDDELKEKTNQATSSCQHIPNEGAMTILRDAGHQMPNNEKVLLKGLKGIKEEVEWYMAQLDQSYTHFGLQEKRDFYKAVLITLDAAMAYAKRYADLAWEMAAKEALQSIWMTHVVVDCELSGGVNSFGRLDQYMYPFYKKSVMDEKALTHDEALELLECFITKLDGAMEPTQSLTIGGQTRDGKDACNEVTMLCLESDEQLSVIQPETAMRIWAGTPYKYLRKAAEVIRLGRGKPKFFSDSKGIKMVSKGYPDLTIEDWREYVVLGCSSTDLPHITMANNGGEGLNSVAKMMELVLNNGKCALCGKQIGPLTGDPRTFESIAAVREAYRQQVFYWMTYLVKGTKMLKENQSRLFPAPFSSSLSEGPLQKGIDITQGGTWYTTYAAFLAGLADTADSLGVVDKLIYRDKKITWDQLLEAIKANWEGYENLRQLCINSVPKYGNDDDFADEWAAWVMDTWQDSIDWINTQKELLPYWGGKWLGKTTVGPTNIINGRRVGALPNGHVNPKPLADTISPSQGVDRNGPTAVIKSVSKLPTHRIAAGGPMNLRLSPQLVATDRDIDNFVSFLRTVEELGIYHIQFNIISSDTLRKAMKEPQNYRDLMVRVASNVAYFVDLDKETQLDIISRTEHPGW